MEPERTITITEDRFQDLLTEELDAARLKDLIIKRYHRGQGISAEEIKFLYEMVFHLPERIENGYPEPTEEGGDGE